MTDDINAWIEVAKELPPCEIVNALEYAESVHNEEEAARMRELIIKWYQNRTPTLFLCRLVQPGSGTDGQESQ